MLGRKCQLYHLFGHELLKLIHYFNPWDTRSKTILSHFTDLSTLTPNDWWANWPIHLHAPLNYIQFHIFHSFVFTFISANKTASNRSLLNTRSPFAMFTTGVFTVQRIENKTQCNAKKKTRRYIKWKSKIKILFHCIEFHGNNFTTKKKSILFLFIYISLNTRLKINWRNIIFNSFAFTCNDSIQPWLTQKRGKRRKYIQ